MKRRAIECSVRDGALYQASRLFLLLSEWTNGPTIRTDGTFLNWSNSTNIAITKQIVYFKIWQMIVQTICPQHNTVVLEPNHIEGKW